MVTLSFCCVFFLIRQDTTWNRGDLSCELSVGCPSVTMDVLCLGCCQLLSQEQLRWFICAVLQHLTQNRRLSSGVDMFGKPQWFDGKSYTWLMWDWVNLAMLVGFAAPECCWAMEKLADVRAERGFSTKDKSLAGLYHIWQTDQEVEPKLKYRYTTRGVQATTACSSFI